MNVRKGSWLNLALRIATLGLCQWEVAAIIADHDRFPTLSRLAGKHRWIAPLLVVSLAVHLWWPEEKEAGLYADEGEMNVEET